MRKKKYFTPPFWMQATVALAQLIIAQFLLASFSINAYLITFWGCYWLKNFCRVPSKNAAILGISLLSSLYAAPVLATVTSSSKPVCGVAFLNQVANLFSALFWVAGAGSSAEEICLTFAAIAGLAAITAIGTLAAGIMDYRRNGTPIGEALSPFGIVLILLLGSVLISRMFIGNYKVPNQPISKNLNISSNQS